MKRGVLFIAILAIAIFFVWVFFFRTSKCDFVACFESKLEGCERAEVKVEKDTGITSYKIKGKDKDNCAVEVKMEKVFGLSRENVELFMGKSMICNVPKEKLVDIKVDDIGKDLERCSGPLKEAMYEVILKKLYTLVTKDLSSVLEEVNKLV